MNAGKWMITIEKEVVMSVNSNFEAALAALFASFYTFNLQYQEDASCTLDFIQRCFVGINPPTGSKTATAEVISKKSRKVVQKKRNTMNAHVCALLRRLMDFEWLSSV